MKKALLKKTLCFESIFTFIILASVFMPKLSADEAAQKIKFFRPSVPGSVLSCNIEAEAKSSTLMTTEDGRKSEKNLCNKIKIAGIMTIKTVTEFGRPATIEFKVDKVKGDINGQEIKFASENKDLDINLESKPCEFRIKDGSADISREEKLLLSLVFRKSGKENLSDFIGTDKEVKVGDSWKTPVGPLQNEFEKRKLKVDDLAVDGMVKLAEKKEVSGYECWLFNAGMNARKGDEFEFDFKVEVSLPTDEKIGAVKTSRVCVEKMSKKIVDKENAMMPDLKEISLTVSDNMTVLAVPAVKK
ncbi:MAG TPA: hypothetical protein DET40_12165 [Lentisphaeria bacterium]|nr:MAG: hypothetical protein A2X45_07715 [Lentisphaerae bacterium GWF2_50_93]HCE44295.1 hypothetical protein [Lentisphaeria bacterium]